MNANPTVAASERILPRHDDIDKQFKIAAILATGLGLGGVDWVTDGFPHTGDWWCFHAVNNCTIASITYQPGTSSGNPAGAVLNAGDRIYGHIISITLTSGTGELYRPAI